VADKNRHPRVSSLACIVGYYLHSRRIIAHSDSSRVEWPLTRNYSLL
jgi:hypothetical protein